MTFYKSHREVLDADIIHVKRADGRGIDYILHANPGGAEKGLVMIYNPSEQSFSGEIRMPVYYTGVHETANLINSAGVKSKALVSRDYNIIMNITVPAGGFKWVVITG